MNIKETKEAVDMLLKTPQPTTPYIKGKPGVGKSAIMKQIADERDIGFIDLRLSQLESADLRGIPTPNYEAGSSEWLPPETIPFESFADMNIPGDDKGRKFRDGGILFMDEFNRARFDVIQAAFQLVLDRRVGLHKLLENWYIVCAGNLGEADNTEVTDIEDAALNNRFAHFTIDDTGLFDPWYEWATNEGDIHPDVLGFLSQRPSDIYTDPKEGEEVFCTPRTWEMFSNVLKLNEDKDPEYIARTIGNTLIGPANLAFITYLQERQEIKPTDVIDNYKKYKDAISALDRSRKYMISSEVGKHIEGMKKVKDKQIDNINAFVNDQLEKDHMIAIFRSIASVMSIEYKGEDKELIDVYLERYPDMNDTIGDILYPTNEE
jgi:hypothetical protein